MPAVMTAAALIHALVLASLFVTCSKAQDLNATTLLDVARREVPGAAWSVSSSVLADLDGDTRPGLIAFAREGETVVVAVVRGGAVAHVDVLRFGIGAATQDAFCVEPRRLVVEALRCDAAETTLRGYRDRTAASMVSIEDEACDVIRLHWDHERDQPAWSRR